MIDIKNNEYFDIFFFHSGEPHIKWEDQNGFFNVVGAHGKSPRSLYNLFIRLKSGNDLLALLCITSAIRQYNKNASIIVTIPYIPGGRQDRVANVGDPFTLKMFADIINAQNYDLVCTIDPHSDMTAALINNLEVVKLGDILQAEVADKGYDTIIIPDAGASKKTFSYYFPDNEYNQRLTFVQCLKKRDTVTGKLSGFKVVDEIPENAKCLLVDDICSAGGTFLGLADEIRKFPIKSLDLFVTHGIFDKGVLRLLEKFNRVITTNSWMNYDEYMKTFFEDRDYRTLKYNKNGDNFEIIEVYDV